MECLQSWPEAQVRVQSLVESGIKQIPHRYIKPPSHRPTLSNYKTNDDIPVINFENAFCKHEKVRLETLECISKASRNLGFFQIANHGVRPELLKSVRDAWCDFFNLPLETKQLYANSPDTYEGYGSCLGIEKGALLDWSDYFFLNLMPVSLRNHTKWPAIPSSSRELIAEYGDEVVKLAEKLMKIFSIDLGLDENHLQNAFGGNEKTGACLRANFYPKCPQPDLTLGLSPHSDPGGLTILLPDENVAGLQVRQGDNWVNVNPEPNAFIVNIGDQIQVLSNAVYKSVEHRVIVNSEKDRASLAMFYNPRSDLLIEPCKQLVTKERPSLYQPMTFDKYRIYIRTKGPRGKQQVESLKCI